MLAGFQEIPPVPPVPPVNIPPIPDFPLQQFPGYFWTADDVLKVVVVSLLGLTAVTWLIARGPIGHAIGAVIRKLAGLGSPEALAGEAEELRRQLDQLNHQYAELAERQDFTERMLAQVRREQLPGSADVKS